MNVEEYKMSVEDYKMNIEHNKKCYRFETIYYESGFLDKTVDCTYIIHLENNGRLPHIYEQLEKYKPTKRCVLLLIRGSKTAIRN
jgi:hypothetical protein